jgi:hypothetical protein
MLEEARQAEICKNDCAAMGWAMFLQMARADPALRVADPPSTASSSSGPDTPVVSTVKPASVEIRFDEGGVPTTIRQVVLRKRGPLTLRQSSAEVIFDIAMVKKIESGEWPLELASDKRSVASYNEHGQDLLGSFVVSYYSAVHHPHRAAVHSI